ncbi:DUF4292 domain-containing protein [Lewinella sp. W8]|uniref:DUF4292 domain-containing protein n=1 Tax=Lewinella sp. W8 TaxID=2528208 RepID=UPI00106875DB|nr:DUF4292 domain-containing protein [Lewinella sp. W8]MTB49580.1 DUF4292 domain-containing protein [Lewinella sp. W8]
MNAITIRTVFLLLGGLLLTASACNKKMRGEDGRDGLTKTNRVSRVLDALDDNRFDTEWLDARARIKVESPKLNIGGTAYIRLEKDKAIWMSVKKFGIEGARALIRPDSFFVINRLQGEYTAEPLSYIEEKYKVPARFDLLQEIVLGNPVFFFRDLEMTTEGENYQLSGRDRRYATNYVIDGRGMRLTDMKLEELAQNRKLSISNGNYLRIEGLDQPDFPHQRSVVIESEATGRAKMDMEFTKLSFSGPLNMPFNKR